MRTSAVGVEFAARFSLQWELRTVKVEEAKNAIAAVDLFMRGFGSELIEVVKLFHYSNCTRLEEIRGFSHATFWQNLHLH